MSAPGVPGPPLHVHHSTSETFFLLDGAVDFRAGEETHRLTAGSVAHVPPGVIHTFVNSGDAVARWVGIFSPGNAMALVEAIGAALPPGGGPPDEAKMAAVVAEHDLEIVPK